MITIFLNSKKSACFSVNKGYFSKWGIITLIISFMDLTVKYAELSFSRMVIFPIPPKKDCIFSNRAISLLCKLIVKTGIIFQPILYVSLLSTNIENVPSPSTKPVT